MSNPPIDAPASPDLRLGVPITAVPDQGVYAGRVGDEPILLARLQNRIVAYGALCSHYGASLIGGRRDGPALTCPQHHACFDLRTGAAVKAPALAPLERWKVEEANGLVFVKERAPPISPSAPARAPDPERIVVIGGGAAGLAAALRLRELGFQGRVTLLSADDQAPYDRPNLSKDYLAGTADPAWMPLKPEAFYKAKRIDLRLGAAVVAIDRVAKTVRLLDGESHTYDKLLLAPGADANRLPGPDFAADNVYVLRSFADADRLIAAAGPGRRAVVVGSSFIGLEVAAALRQRGVDVAVVAPETLPLESRLGPLVGTLVKTVHERHGVRFHLGRGIDAYDGRQARLDDGTVLEADFLVLGVGAKPRLDLAVSAGLAMDRGISVDATMRSSDPDIYAAGDVARYPNPIGGAAIRSEHWVVAQRQGQVAAASMLGLPARLEDPPFFWSAHFDVTLRYVGHAERWDAIDVDGSVAGQDVELRYLLEGQVRAVLTINRDAALLEASAKLAALQPAALG